MNEGWQWLNESRFAEHWYFAWPFRDDVWRDNAAPAQRALVQLVAKLLPFHAVTVIVRPEFAAQARRQLPQATQLLNIAYDDVWLRDYSPLFRRSRQHPNVVSALSFGFDGWGGVQLAMANDRQFAKALLAHLALPQMHHQAILEAGAVSHDGAGTVLLGTGALLRGEDDAAQRKALQQRWQVLFKQALGVEQCVWLGAGLQADETAGHVDNQAVFVDDDRIIYSLPNFPSHPDWRTCQAIEKQLIALQHTKTGKPYRLVALPLPEYGVATERQRRGVKRVATALYRSVNTPILRSYVNSIVTPKVILVPQFGIAEDQQTLAILQAHFSEREVLGVAAEEWVLAGGGPHCLSCWSP